MSNNKYKILVMEDEGNIRSFVQTVLENGGYHVLTASTCSQGEMMFYSHVPDLVILDLGLPDMDGEEFIRQIRSISAVPIIVLSARVEESDKVSALDLGANDYITKPFGTAELQARVRASLRTARHHVQAAALNSVFVLEDMTIDYDRRTVSVSGEEIHLTQTEYNILAYLTEYCGKVMTYSAIIKAVWGYPYEGSVKKLQVNMANIRKKLGERPGESNYIYNELGVGYRMHDAEE